LHLRTFRFTRRGINACVVACVQVSLKQVGAAVTACLKMKDVFTQETVTSVLSNLVHQQRLPKLIMRTLINAWELHPESRRCAACMLPSRHSPVTDFVRSSMLENFPSLHSPVPLHGLKADVLLPGKSAICNISKHNFVNRQ
jgi:Symplekin tight junction protein C terminal